MKAILTTRQLVYEPFRTGLTCIAIASALAVILLLEGFQSGLVIQLEKVALKRGADLIVAQTGVTNFIGSRSLLPQLSRQTIESIGGVGEAHPITMVPVIYEQEGYRKSPIFFVVYDIRGGPAVMKEGHAAKENRGIVIDESLAVLYGLKVGDRFVIADFEFHITGIAAQASALFTAFAFIDYDDMIDFFFDSDLVGDISNLPLLSYLLIELEPGADQSAIADAIEELVSEADVFTPEQLSKNDGDLGRTLFGPVMGVLIGVGYVIALLVIGMIMFATVHARLRNFGVMKALGFSNHDLVKVIILESVLMVLMAFPFALLIAQFGSWIIEVRMPLYLVPVTETVPLLRTIVAAIVLGVIGAYLPYRLIAKLDSAIVFRV
jgi:putative ABC transport system permease protein